MVIDIILAPARTEYELYQRRWNNMQAQWIGMSKFSKTIEVQYV